jgi:hypothetical protein
MSDDDDLEYEEFLEMSEAQTDALLNRLMDQHERRLRAMSPQQLYRYFRATRLDLCRKQRRMAKDWPEIFGPMLRSTQRRLLEARIQYWTGATVGHS